MNEQTKVDTGSQRISLTEANGLHTGPVSMEPYRSAAYFDLERDRIFRRAWLMLCRVEEIPNPGDYVLKQVEVCDAQVLITRLKDGSVRAMHNVCPHRGNLVVLDDAGNASKLVCRYHSWVFSNDGSLIGVPDEGSFFKLDKKKCGMTPIASEVWEGFVFINFCPVPEVSLAEFLGDFGEYLKGFPYVAADNPIIFTADLECNWKVVSDAFSEAYHIPAIHPETLGATFTSHANPYAHVLDGRLFGPHRMVSLFGNSEYKPKSNSKVEKLGQSLLATGNTISAVSRDSIADFLAHRAVNPTKADDWSMDINHIFPNTQIDAGQGGFFVHQYWPISVDRTRHELRFYVTAPTNVVERFRAEQYFARVGEVLLEDLTNVARTQIGLKSRAKDFMVLQDNEMLLRHSVAAVEKWVASATVREALS